VPSSLESDVPIDYPPELDENARYELREDSIFITKDDAGMKDEKLCES
jgi:hypothetical protein